MTQIEQIIAEIERLKAEAFNKIHHDARRDMVTDVSNSQRIAICEQLLDFIDSLPAEQPCDDLEEEINSYSKESLALKFPTTDKKQIKADIEYIARHFANWQKEQMMKSAIDATCVILPPPDLFKVLICHEVTDKLANKQKIKIITVKEDEQ